MTPAAISTYFDGSAQNDMDKVIMEEQDSVIKAFL
jgi:hypothetical protein